MEEIVVLLQQESDGTITLVAPLIQMRSTEQKDLVWVVAMTGDYDDRFSISIGNFKRDGIPVAIFQSSDLTKPLPKSGKWRKLQGKIKKKAELPEGNAIYTYDVTFSSGSKALGERSERGELELCPVWPCD